MGEKCLHTGAKWAEKWEYTGVAEGEVEVETYESNKPSKPVR